MKIVELTNGVNVFATNEEVKLLQKLDHLVRLESLDEHEQFRIQGMIRKNLVTKKGFENPKVVSNEKK